MRMRLRVPLLKLMCGLNRGSLRLMCGPIQRMLYLMCLTSLPTLLRFCLVTQAQGLLRLSPNVWMPAINPKTRSYNTTPKKAPRPLAWATRTSPSGR
jgi:hypothetical protein